MKNRMCEVTGCNKTGTRRVGQGHWICEDCAKAIRKAKRHRKITVFFKEIPIGTFGGKFTIFTDIPIKIRR